MRVLFLRKEIVMYFYAVWVIQFFNYFELSIRIFGVLVNLLNRYLAFITFSFGLVDYSKRSLSNDLLPGIVRRFVECFFLLDLWGSLFFFFLSKSRKQRLVLIEKIWINLSFLFKRVDIVGNISF